MREYFPESKFLVGRVKVELGLSNYVAKSVLKNAAGVDTSKFAKKVDLANLKSNVDKLDIYKLKNVPTNLSNQKSTVDKLDIDKLVPVLIDLSKLSDLKSEKNITDHNHDKYITTPKFDNFTAEIFDLRLNRANLVRESDTAHFLNKTDFDNQVKNVTSNKHNFNDLSKKL